MGILRMITVIFGVGLLAMVVLSAGITFMPGTKIGHVFGASQEALAGHEPQHSTIKERNDAVDAGTAADAGTVAATPAGPKPAAPAEAQALPEQQGR